MFNPQARAAQDSPRSLMIQRALAAAFKAHRQSIPQAPPGLPALLDALRQGPSGLIVKAVCRDALREIHAGLFSAPGRDVDVQTRWHESLATAVFAGRLAELHGVAADTVCMASLLHRSGELLALKILARVELEHRIKLDSASRRDWCSSHNEELTQRLLGVWGLAPQVASCALGWTKYGEQAHASREGVALYFGRLFAIELLQPDLCVPGALEHAAADMGLSERQVGEVRAESTRARELLRMLDQPQSSALHTRI